MPIDPIPLRIGSLCIREPVLLAPMAGYTDTCTRRIARSAGAGLVFTEMISAKGLIRRAPSTLSLIAFHPEEKPIGVQLFGSDPSELAEAARIAQDLGASLIDINMGCPVKKVCRIGAGAALLRVPNQVAEILKAVRKATHCPLTIKIRLGWDERSVTALEISRIAEENGVDAITLHPRTRSQGFSGTADWSWIERLKAERKIPVIGNGDISSPHRAFEALNSGWCDGVMIGRGARGNPWLFSQTLDLLAGNPFLPPTAEERFTVLAQHAEALLFHYGSNRGIYRIRLLVPHYVRGMPGAAAFRSQAALVGTGGARELLGLLRAVLRVG